MPVPVPALPRLASGKIDYAKLRELAPARKAGLTGDIVDAFRQAFYPKPVSRADNFGTLGYAGVGCGDASSASN